MSVIVEPELEFPTHHVSLSDGVNKVGLILCDSQGNASPHAINRVPTPRTAMKTTSGNQKYSDFEPPWSPVAQDDWSGGRGQEDFDLDVTRYMDGWRANTLYGQIIMGGQETYTLGYRNQDFVLPGSVKWVDVISGDTNFMAVRFNASANYSAAKIYLWLKRYGTPPASLTVELCSDSSGSPGTVLRTATVSTTDITDTVSVFRLIPITAISLTSTTPYWIKIYSSGGTSDHHWSVGTNNASGTSVSSANGTIWGAAPFNIYHRIADARLDTQTMFFQYRRCQYAIYNRTSSAPLLYINGDRGVAQSNAGNLSTVVGSAKTWALNEWVGCVVVVINGAGSNEPQPWRLITSNTGTTLTVNTPWLTAHTTTTEYIIIASNKWTEVTGHGLTVNVTSVLVANNTCYFAQGDAVNIRRMRWFNNAGAATYQYADDGTNKATFLCTVRDSTTGNDEVWRGNNQDGTSSISVSKAPVVAWGTNMTFAAAIVFTDPSGNITGITEYGQSVKYPWVFREGSVFAIVTNKPDEIPLREMRAAAEFTNGRVAMAHGVYLFFNFGDGLERYYNSLLDDVGPNRDEGLPANRQGVISCMAGYPGQILIGVDAVSGFSSVLCKREGGEGGSGWCEIYRAPAEGQRIWDVGFQPIPGSTIDRLWVAVGNDIVWLPIPSGAKKPTTESAYRYIHESVIECGYVYVGMYDIFKFFHSLKLFTENLQEDVAWVEADYRLDDNTAWIPLKDAFNQSPMHENKFTAQYGENGKRIQIRLRLQTANNAITPIIKGTVIENVSRVPVKYSFSLVYRNNDNDINLRGEPEEMNAEEKGLLLDEWAEQLTPLHFRSIHKRYDDHVVFIDPAQLQAIREKSEGYIERLTLTGV